MPEVEQAKVEQAKVGQAKVGQAAPDPTWREAVEQIVAAGRRMHQHGWVPATAGNLSRRLEDGRLAITRSGGHKGFLTGEDVIEVAPDGRAICPHDRPSAETLLHCQIYAGLPEAGAVLHGHSVAATVLSMIEPAPALLFAGYELLKAFEGQTTHRGELSLPMLDNDQDIARLCAAVAPGLDAMRMGYLIRGHGVYVWASSMDLALVRLEALEFLLDCALARRGLERGARASSALAPGQLQP